MSDAWAEYRQRAGNFAGQSTGATVPTSTDAADASARTRTMFNPGFSIPCSSTSRPAGFNVGNQFNPVQAMQYGHL